MCRARFRSDRAPHLVVQGRHGYDILGRNEIVQRGEVLTGLHVDAAILLEEAQKPFGRSAARRGRCRESREEASTLSQG